ncbi:MAG: EF-hand domain-containing protein [Pseudomonadota bacterium]
MTTTTTLLAGTLALSIGLTGLSALSAEAEGRAGDGARFSELDADGNAEVSLAEMRAFGDARFEATDADGDGALSMAEILAAREAQSADQREARISRFVERADANGNGTLERDEFGAGADRMEARFERLDADGSGGLSPEEMRRAREARGFRFGRGDGRDRG